MPKVTRSSDNRLMHGNSLPKDRIWNDTSATFWKREKEYSEHSDYSEVWDYFLKSSSGSCCHLGWINSQEIESCLLRVCKIDSVFWIPTRPKEQTCNCIQGSWTSCRCSTWLQWGLEVIPLQPPWAGANTQLELWQFGLDCPSTWGDQLWLTGRLPWGTAILPSLQTSQCLCTFLDRGQRETRSLTGYKSDGGSRQDRCGKAATL